MTRTSQPVWLFALVFLGPLGSSWAATPTPASLALAMLDSEALYTLSAGLKPVSEGFWRSSFPKEQDTSPEVQRVRTLLRSLPLGSDLEAGVLVFAQPLGNKRSATAFVTHKPRLRALIQRRRDVFAPIGITPDTSPQQVLERIDRAPSSSRWRAFGLVFGYPDYAVEFFVSAGEQQQKTGQFVTRDFLNLPTFVSDRGRFVYAVPKGHVEREEDRRLKTATSDILNRYRAWRLVYLDQNHLDPVTLLRYWVSPPQPDIVVSPPTPLPTCSVSYGAGPWTPRRFCPAIRPRFGLRCR